MENKIRILNALPGESLFTSRNRAEKFIKAGLATMKPNGLLFVHSLRHYRRNTAASDDYWASKRKCITWSGSAEERVLFRPGEVRS